MIRAATTRLGLLDVRARASVAQKGARLLRAKREVLAGEIWKMMREVLAGRAKLDEVLRAAVKALGLAKALDGQDALESLAPAAARDVAVQVTVRRVWGVPTPIVAAPPLLRAADRRGTAPTSWGLAGVEAARRHEEALDVLLGIATREKHLVRLGEEIQETSRRVNALEQVLLPALAAEARRVRTALEERDREDAVRLRRFRRKRSPPAEASAQAAPRTPTAPPRAPAALPNGWNGNPPAS